MPNPKPLTDTLQPKVADQACAVWCECASFCVASLFGSVAFWLLIQRSAYASLSAAVQTLEEARLIPITVCAQSLLFLLPGLSAAVLLLRYWRRRRLANYSFVLWSSLAFAFEALDLKTYDAFGRHLRQIARFAALPSGVQAAGSSEHWGFVAVRVLALSALGSVLCMIVVRRALSPLAGRSSPFLRRSLTALALPVLGFGAAEPWFAGVLFHHPDLRERLYKQLVWSPPRSQLPSTEFRDPNWAALDAGLRKAYVRAFPRLFAEQRMTLVAEPSPDRLSVLIVLVESWRADSLTPQRMPRLAAWAEGGLVAEQHYGGSDYSEAGMFSLLYGRSPLLFHAALDAHEPAAWCPAAHELGMACSYFSGHPEIWMRREEFLNAGAVDHFVHDDSGDWNQWDRTALQRAVQALQAPSARPQIAMAYLMSTHFEYEYPAAYERHLPVRHDMSWRGTETSGLGPEDRIPVTNRYLNSLAFTDDLVADAIAKLDPKRTIVVLTGDHGESLGEDGHFGHGYGFPNSIAKVPFAIVGPGIAPSHREAPSLHADLLRTLVHALGGRASGPSDSEDLLTPQPPRAGLLLAHCSYGHKKADALLIRGATRLRFELGLWQPTVTLLWPEDDSGHPEGTGSINADQVRQLVSTFETELAAIYSPSRSL